ncbi:ATP-binding protein [Streptomyces coeruleorubidus]|uniref:ATP-binding protein n=1 Tax=Streptomyces coeruleorubidus TaxID=116188 RepID=UPI00381E0C48
MLQLSGPHLPEPDARYGPFPQPPLGAGLSLEFTPEPSAVREARAQVRRQLEGWGLAERGEVADAAELLVGELATNALVHVESHFRLTLFAAHGVLRWEVADGERRVPRVLEAGTGENGRGMFLVDALAQRWGCHRDGPGKTVWFELGTCGSDGCGRRQP